jgi:transcriptional regulator with XRE-family HTH domain
MRSYDVEIAIRSVGTAVRQAREEINYTVGDLAETSGLAADEIMEIETGMCRDRQKLCRIAQALHVSADVFAI